MRPRASQSCREVQGCLVLLVQELQQRYERPIAAESRQELVEQLATVLREELVDLLTVGALLLAGSAFHGLA